MAYSKGIALTPSQSAKWKILATTVCDCVSDRSADGHSNILSISRTQASFSCDFGDKGWRKRPFYMRDMMELTGARTRRGGGLLFTLVLAEHGDFAKSSRGQKLLAEGFKCAEVSYEEANLAFGNPFRQLLEEVMGCTWEDTIKTIDVPAPIRNGIPDVIVTRRIEMLDDFGTW